MDTGESRPYFEIAEADPVRSADTDRWWESDPAGE